jgi:hypothetical protein
VTMKYAALWDVMTHDSCKDDVSEELVASIIRVERTRKLVTTLAVTCN